MLVVLPHLHRRLALAVSLLMAQFNIDVDSGVIRISQLIYGICPGMSQATLFSSNSSFVAPALNREGLVRLERVRNTPLTCVMFCWA